MTASRVFLTRRDGETTIVFALFVTFVFWMFKHEEHEEKHEGHDSVRASYSAAARTAGLFGCFVQSAGGRP